MNAMKKIRLGRLDMNADVKNRKTYEARLAKLQTRMLSIQQAYYRGGRRGIVVVEGWDAAGKGGMIHRMVELLDPRGVHVWPIAAPDPLEQARHYLYRFWTKLPEPGRLAVFDRSWYGRVLVERVEGLADKAAWRRAYEEIRDFEAMLIADGVRIVKIFLHISPEEQLRRFAERLDNPFKRWKLTPADIQSHLLHDRYVAAADEMFDRTSTRDAPWFAIPANHKWHARLAAIENVADVLAKGVDLHPPPVDKKLRKAALRVLSRLKPGEGGTRKTKDRR